MIQELTKTQQLIIEVCDEVKNLLLIKNQDYGNSFQDPINIFSKSSSSIEQVNNRIDDKLKRIKNNKFTIKEDTELDLIGYLILRRVLLKIEGNKVDSSAKKECNEHKKVYSYSALLSNPPQSKWICELCGEKGIDNFFVNTYPKYIFSYDKLCKKFHGNSK
jgi:hypothetical protein